MDLEAVFTMLQPPTACGSFPEWQGREITFSGRLDPANIFFKARHPQLPYEKFVVNDGLGRAMEVWPDTPDNGRLFADLVDRSTDRMVVVVVTGRLTSFKMPVGQGCTWGAKVVVDHVDQIQFAAE